MHPKQLRISIRHGMGITIKRSHILFLDYSQERLLSRIRLNKLIFEKPPPSLALIVILCPVQARIAILLIIFFSKKEINRFHLYL